MNKLFILGLLLLGLIVYFNSFDNNFVFDDIALVVHNPLVKSLKLSPKIFTTDIFDSFFMGLERESNRVYRPLQVLSYFIDYKIWGLSPMGFRLTNVILHFFDSLLVYYLILMLSGDIKFSLLASTLFLVHPIHTSAVSYIAGRADLLSCFFMLSSIILFLRFIERNSYAYYGLSLFLGICALFSRENAIFLFIFIALALFIQKAKFRHYRFVIPFILFDLLYLSLRFSLFSYSGLSLSMGFLSFPLRLVNFFNVTLRYLFILFLPLDLHLLRTTPFITNLLDIKAIPALLFFLSYLLILIRLRKNRLIVFSMLWFLGGIIPVFIYLDRYVLLNRAMMAESWIYLSSIGFFIIFALFFNRLKKLGRIIIICFIIFYSLLTITNNVYWKDGAVLYERTLKYTPGQDPVRKKLINDYLFVGFYNKALAQIKIFAASNPASPQTDILWGNYYFFTDRTDLAIDKYNKAVSQEKDFFVYYRLSSCYQRIQQLDLAIHFGLESLRINPFFAMNLIQLGDLYAEKKDLKEAKRYYQMAARFNPHSKALEDVVKNAK